MCEETVPTYADFNAHIQEDAYMMKETWRQRAGSGRTQIDLHCDLCDATCHNAVSWESHMSGAAHGQAVQVAQRAASMFSAYLTEGVCSRWRPPFNDRLRWEKRGHQPARPSSPPDPTPHL